MRLSSNRGNGFFTPADGVFQLASGLSGFVRDWAWPATLLVLWIVTFAYTASQLVTVEGVLRAIPDLNTNSRPPRTAFSARR